MEIGSVLLLMGVLVLALATMRIPVALILLIVGVFGVGLIQGWGTASSVLSRVPYNTPLSYTLVILPMFIAMGVLAKGGGLATDGFALAARLTHRLPGGLAVAAVAACAAFAAVSGSSVATVVTLGPIAVQEMRRHGYDLVVAAGVVGASGTLGVMIPPSIVLVLYGILTGESVGALLLAGIIPGLMTAALFSAALIVRALMSPEKFGKGSEVDIAHEASRVLRPMNIVKLIVLFTVVMGGIYTGLATPTEAAALGAVVALVFYLYDLVSQRTSGWRKESVGVFTEAIRLTAMTMALLIGGAAFTYALVVARVPASFAQWIGNLELPRLVIACAILLGFIVLGMFIDGLSILLIAVPLAYPAMMELGYDGIWFGVLVVKAIEVGLITPPFGMNAYVLTGVAKELSLGQAFKGVLWFLPLEFVAILLLFVFPEIATWLPTIAGV